MLRNLGLNKIKYNLFSLYGHGIVLVELQTVT